MTPDEAKLAAKQFAIDHLSDLCQEVVAWHNGVAPIQDGLLSQLATICSDYCDGDDREVLGRTVEAVVVQTALLYVAGAGTTPEEARDQVTYGFTLSLEPDRPTH
ncbi:TPA: hypothetical protein ACWLUJ_006199 [Pseudomonas aeruginosa]|nr:hypothetical protein [Pseudomonas aeruginosa]EIU2863546.1 hypothetical protein [Pseudomonas aeruginosa]HEJ2342733.1 hypothetical protein [Pseudomonas aeruginosa]HEK3717312.1 hypothetical protein [Pseudomonas aeruginosa]